MEAPRSLNMAECGVLNHKREQAHKKRPQFGLKHGLRTHNEGKNQRNLKFWADMADKICFSRTYEFGIGV